MSWLIRLAFIFSVLLHIQSVFSAPVFYSDRNLFLQDFAGLDLIHQDFEGLEPFGARVGGGIDQYVFDGWSVEAELSALKVMNRAYSGNHNTSPGGRQYFSIDTDRSWQGVQTRFISDSPILALGFNLIDHDADDMRLGINGIEHILPEVSDAEVAFWGVSFDDGSAMTEFWLDSGKDAQISLDDLAFVHSVAKVISVDEPGSLCLISIGILVLFLRYKARNYCLEV